MPVSATHTCTTCHRIYHRKTYYNRHVLLCEIMSKSDKDRRLENEERGDTPTVRRLYEIILELTGKMQKMEHQLQELTKWTDVKKRKINILEWLNEPSTPANESTASANTSFEELLGQLTVERRHLDHLFRTDYTSALLLLLQEHLPLEPGGGNPLKAFDQKTQVLYAYSNSSTGASTGASTGNKKWIIVTELMFKTLLFVADKKLLAEFIKWQTENGAHMADDDFAVKYALNVKKIMGGNLSREQIYSRLKIDLYKYLKVCLRNITECEFD